MYARILVRYGITSLISYYPLAPTLFDICKIYHNKEKAEEVIHWFRVFQMNADKGFDDAILQAVADKETELKNWV
ncbi:hypothetical protein ACU8DI_10950 [Psychroserpens sp. BH13MA-6]